MSYINLTVYKNLFVASNRRESLVSFNGSDDMGSVTRTPCDATINMSTNYNLMEDTSSNQINPGRKKLGKCCKEKNLVASAMFSGFEADPVPFEYTPPPAYHSEERIINSEDKSSSNSGFSYYNQTEQKKELDEEGIRKSDSGQGRKLDWDSL